MFTKAWGIVCARHHRVGRAAVVGREPIDHGALRHPVARFAARLVPGEAAIDGYPRPQKKHAAR